MEPESEILSATGVLALRSIVEYGDDSADATYLLGGCLLPCYFGDLLVHLIELNLVLTRALSCESFGRSCTIFFLSDFSWERISILASALALSRVNRSISY